MLAPAGTVVVISELETTSNTGLLAPELAVGIARVKSAKSIGIRSGNWLSLNVRAD
jgi:hypothetical protein